MIGERIKTARKMRGLTQTMLSDLIGLSQSAVSEWESGRTDPTTDSLLSLATSLNVSFEWLATGRGQPEYHEQTATSTRQPAVPYGTDPDLGELTAYLSTLNSSKRQALVVFLRALVSLLRAWR